MWVGPSRTLARSGPAVTVASDFPEFSAVVDLVAEVESHLAGDIHSVSRVVASSLWRGQRLLICGNGGSAADSQHLAGELVSSFTMGVSRPALPAIALTTDSSILTAYANDFDFAGVFSRQVEAHGQSGDVFLGISTSGRSVNVVAAAETALRRGLTVLGLTGKGPNPLTELAHHSVAVPSTDTQAIQTLHIIIAHIICRVVEDSYTEREGAR